MAAIETAANATVAAIEAAIAAVDEFGTVFVPADTRTWTTGLVVTKACSIIAAGNDETTIYDDVCLMV
jgi:hypothetical protein